MPNFILNTLKIIHGSVLTHVFTKPKATLNTHIHTFKKIYWFEGRKDCVWVKREIFLRWWWRSTHIFAWKINIHKKKSTCHVRSFTSQPYPIYFFEKYFFKYFCFRWLIHIFVKRCLTHNLSVYFILTEFLLSTFFFDK